MRIILLALFCIAFGSMQAQKTTVAAAANVRFAIKEIAKKFEAETGVEVELVTSSSGKLATQIRNGAPYDVFLAANMKYVQSLENSGFCATKPQPYVYGKLVMWTVKEADLSNGISALTAPDIEQIAIANPKNAPYGVAAVEAIKELGLYDSLQMKLIYGESISQVNQYTKSEAADVGLTAKSVVLSKMSGVGTWEEVPDSLYTRIMQGAALLKYGVENNREAATKFYNYIFSAAAGDIWKKHGYGIPDANPEVQVIGSNSEQTEVSTWEPFWLTFKLAAITTLILFLIGIPIAWWLSSSKWKLKPVVEALVALPIVLPPTVLGFYLLIVLNPENGLGGWLNDTFGIRLAFEFPGLVIGSMIYSLPFMVQPLQSGFDSIPKSLKEMATTLGKSRWQILFKVLLPNMKPSLITGTVLSFAHTIGEFGVVLMIGGMIPGKTRVASVAIYDEVDALNFDQAHIYSGVLLGIAFLILLLVFVVNKRLKTVIR